MLDIVILTFPFISTCFSFEDQKFLVITKDFSYVFRKYFIYMNLERNSKCITEISRVATNLSLPRIMSLCHFFNKMS